MEPVIRNVDTKISRIRYTLEKMVERCHPYAQKMKDLGVKPEHIKPARDIRLLPFMTKQDLQQHYPLGWLNVDRKNVVRFHATSGTTGNPTVVCYTQNDIKMWAESGAWCLGLAGLDEWDTLQVSYGYGLFTGGLGMHYAGERRGLAVIPASGGATEKQVHMIKELGVTALACTPSYALRISEVWDDIDPDRFSNGGTKLKIGILGAEPWSEGLRKRLEEKLGIKALDIYGLSEAMGPGIAMECLQQNGLHFNEEAFFPEIIDPDTEKNMENGEEGELVLTSIKKEAFPLIRYRTHDRTRFLSGPCPCGDPSVRIGRIGGRTDDMLIIRGVNVFPTQIEAAICCVKGLTPNFIIDAWKKEGMDEISITCERALDSDPGTIEQLAQNIRKRLKDSLGVNVPFKIAEPETLPRTEGKAKHLVRH
ncbi:MAG: phenylacetate--CoA ligase [Synergistaceae bacterium]|nr:phenylacetate--CoA ligase [Synergistaceae bacterium]